MGKWECSEVKPPSGTYLVISDKALLCSFGVSLSRAQQQGGVRIATGEAEKTGGDAAASDSQAGSAPS